MYYKFTDQEMVPTAFITLQIWEGREDNDIRFRFDIGGAFYQDAFNNSGMSADQTIEKAMQLAHKAGLRGNVQIEANIYV